MPGLPRCLWWWKSFLPPQNRYKARRCDLQFRIPSTESTGLWPSSADGFSIASSSVFGKNGWCPHKAVLAVVDWAGLFHNNAGRQCVRHSNADAADRMEDDNTSRESSENTFHKMPPDPPGKASLCEFVGNRQSNGWGSSRDSLKLFSETTFQACSALRGAFH